ncbi:sensor histidine kinase [Saccharopolyspora shandongensis]|uniref:sensor histidine kinase n=1 Tax=Saccharopolyspora shandongensis TaxID=418495 RepID=UPI00340ADD2A
MRYVREVLLIAGVAAALVLVANWERQGPVDLPLLAAFSVGVGLPLPARRALPLTVAVASAVIAVLGMAVLPNWPGMLVAMGAFCAAVYHRPRNPLLVLAISTCWSVGTLLVAGGPVQVFTATDLVVMAIAPVATGYALRLHRERAGQVLRLQRAESDRLLAEERAWLTRNVHDSVGHHLTAIRLQATATRRALDGASPAADRALGTISELSRTALGEVRNLLRELREEPAATQPGLADLDRLADRLSSGERKVSLHRTGIAAGLPPAVDRTAYRVVQEALTNAARHSGAAEVVVRLRQDERSLHIEVTDDGPPTAAGAEGQGIRGMRERVHLLCGTLSVGPARPNGWRVAAELPVGRAVR